VDWIIKDVQKEGSDEQAQFNILDIGTGSGCIPISIKKNLPEIQVTSLDISSEAIKTAETNASINDTRIIFIQDDILNPVQPDIVSGEYDLIVSNPPYVTHLEKMQMHPNVLNFEPHTALFVEDNNPLQFYKAIAIFAKDHLKDEGSLYLEINENLGQQTVDLLRQHGYQKIQLRKDLRDSDRMIKAIKPSGTAN
jgi:release factor glutamine methyltransferase